MGQGPAFKVRGLECIQEESAVQKKYRTSDQLLFGGLCVTRHPNVVCPHQLIFHANTVLTCEFFLIPTDV